MKLTKFEQSGFILETENGFRVAIDIAIKTPLEKLENIPAVDAFLVSHIHPDHFSAEHINKLKPATVCLNSECIDGWGEQPMPFELKKVASGDAIDLGPISIEYFNVDHGPNIPEPIENHGFIITVDGQKIYFAGDMYYPSGIDTSNLEVDYAILPVGDFYTFNPETAYAFAKTFKKIGTLIPMHDRGEVEKTDAFVALASPEFHVIKM